VDVEQNALRIESLRSFDDIALDVVADRVSVPPALRQRCS